MTYGATHPARAAADAWIAQGRASAAAEAHAQAVTDMGPEEPVEALPLLAWVDLPGCEHRVPPVAVEVIGEAHVLEALDAMAAAFERCRAKRVTRGRALPAAPYDVDDHVSGAR